MAFKRKYPNKRYGKGTKKLEKRVKKLEKDVGVVEMKYYDHEVSVQQIDWSGQLYDLTIGISQGTTDVQRIGDKITIKKIDIHWVVESNPAIPVPPGSPNTNNCSVGFVWDKRGGTTTVGTFMDNSNSVLASMGLINYDQRHNYTLFKNKHFSINNITTPMMFYHSSYKCNKQVSYLAGSTNVITNSLKMFTVNDISSTPGISPFFSCACRVYYTDV